MPSSSLPLSGSIQPSTSRRTARRNGRRSLSNNLSLFKVEKIQVVSQDLTNVRLILTLLDGDRKEKMDVAFSFGKSSSIKTARDILNQFQDSTADIFPLHVDMLARRINEALHEHREVFNKSQELKVRLSLEDMLIKAGITDAKVTKLFVENEITVADLMEGCLSENDLKEILPKLGPRRRLMRIVRNGVISTSPTLPRVPRTVTNDYVNMWKSHPFSIFAELATFGRSAGTNEGQSIRLPASDGVLWSEASSTSGNMDWWAAIQFGGIAGRWHEYHRMGNSAWDISEKVAEMSIRDYGQTRLYRG